MPQGWSIAGTPTLTLTARRGQVDYRAEDLGLDKDDLRRRFAPYNERFVTV